MVKLETERLILREWNEHDHKDLVEGLNNLNVSKWLAFVPYPYTKKDAESFIKYARTTSDYEWAIVLKKENKVIGGVGLKGVNETQRCSNGGGIWINESYHHEGYGYEAFYARTEFAIKKLNLRRLDNGYFKGNEASCNLQKKAGYKVEGIKRNKYICLATGEIFDEVITGLLKEEFIDKNL